ncbi:MAG: hypothetical protein JSW34_02160 [Candidatus Zixiibacteriota bacterium]|nr:MAG: hypothetical protein JSW34_02160 [candidate division Zixibacteria bacterium]
MMRKVIALAALLVLFLAAGIQSADVPPVTEGAKSATADVSANEFVDPDDIYWSPLGSGMDGRVLALTVYEGKLIAGGDFTTAGGVLVNHIASWDGSNWSWLRPGPPLDPGCDDRIVAMTVYDEKLIVAGNFHTAGGVAANHIASWDGSSWSPLGSGTSGGVKALAVYGDQLFVGGYFGTAGGVEVNNIASWDGSTWSPLGSGTNGDVRALTVYDGKLIAAGSFVEIEPWPVFTFMCIASWDGSSWSQVGYPLWTWPISSPKALTVYNGALYAGGRAIQEFSEEICSRAFIHVWNGSGWCFFWTSYCSYGYPGRDSYTLNVYDGRLVAGGIFGSEEYIRSWGGISNGFGSNTDGPVHALTAYNAELIVGGDFTMAGDKAAAYIAAWTKRDPCCETPGAVDHDGDVDALDFQCLHDYLHKDGPEPCLEEADVNGDGVVDGKDMSCLGRHLYSTGNPCEFVECP